MKGAEERGKSTGLELRGVEPRSSSGKAASCFSVQAIRSLGRSLLPRVRTKRWRRMVLVLCCLLYVYGRLVDGAEELAHEALIKAAGTPLLQARLQELTVALGLDDG